MPSRRVQISDTATRSSSSRRKEGSPALARSTNNATADSPDNDDNGKTCSPATARGSRLVANTMLCPPPMIASAHSAAASRTCSQLSSNTSRRRPLASSARLDSAERSAWRRPPTAASTISLTASPVSTFASEASQTPPRNSGNASAAACNARRVLPMPPTPVIVTTWASSSAATRARTSASRPTSEVRCAGRLERASSSVRSGGKSSSKPGATTCQIRMTEVRSRRRCSPRSRSTTRSSSSSTTAFDTRTWPP